jgi:molecular chaperone HtpG
MFPDTYNIVVNSNHPLVAEKLIKMKNKEKKEDFAYYLVQLGLLNQGMLKGEELSKFINRSIEFVK